MAERTTEDVRQIVAVLASRLGHVETHWVPDDRATPMPTAEVLREFDAALTAHDAEVRAQARMLAFADFADWMEHPENTMARDARDPFDLMQKFVREARARAERGEA